MNIQKSLYRTLLRLGVNMIRPQDYVVSEIDHHPDLVFGFLKQDGDSMYVLLANYCMVDGKALPEPEVVLRVSPPDKTATTVTCEWPSSKEMSSKALDRRVKDWLETQVSYGHTFRGRDAVKGKSHAIAA